MRDSHKTFLGWEPPFPWLLIIIWLVCFLGMATAVFGPIVWACIYLA